MTIPANKNRIPIIFFIALVISVILLSFIIANSAENFFVGVCVGILPFALIIAIITLLDYIKTIFDKKAILIINENGINDNLNLFSVGNINWTDITDIKVIKSFKTTFLVIEVSNPQTFIYRNSLFKRKILRSFLKKFGSPIVISEKRINYDINKLKETLINIKNK